MPLHVEDLLVAGRCFSSDAFANDLLNLIPFCIAMGEAAGTASALAVAEGVTPRQVSHVTLQRRLREQGVFIPPELAT